MRLISARWILKFKPGTSSQPPKLKARIVGRGFQQQEGVDFDDIFIHVVRWSTIRTVLALVLKTAGR
jgi:hypothetical protein